MFAGFPVIEIDVVMRRTLRSAVVLAVVAVVAAIALGQPLVAPGVIVGLIMAVVNHRIFQASAMRFTTPEGTVARKPFASSVLARLGACTAVAGLLLVFVRPMGWGVIGGLVAFQMLLLLNATISLIKYQRTQMAPPGDRDA